MAEDPRTEMGKGSRTPLKPRLFTGIFILIIAISMASFLMGQGANAGTSVYLNAIGESTSLAGIGALTFSLAAAVSRIVSGALIDSRGRAIMMVVGGVLMVAGTAMPLLGNTGAAFIVWRVLQGAGFAATTTAAATAAADVLPLSRLGEGIGYYGLGQAISMSVGPALAIFLVATDPPENFYIGLTCCAVLALVLSLCCRYEKDPSKLPETSEYRMRFESGDVPRAEAGESEPEPNAGTQAREEERRQQGAFARALDSIFEPKAIPGTLPIMFIATSFGFGIFFVGVFGASISVSNAGFFFTLAAVSMILVRLLSGRFMDKVAPIKIMGAAVICGLVCFSMLYGCSHMEAGGALDATFYLAGIFYGVSLGVALPINQTVAVRMSPTQRWGAANGLFLLGNDIAIGIASLAWGVTNEALGFDVTILFVMGFIALSFFVALACYPKEKV